MDDTDKNGVAHGLALQWVSPDDGSCGLQYKFGLPEGLRLTNNQFFIAYIIALGGVSMMQLNMIYMFIYWAEMPFFEQFKCVSDPWPWKTDYEGFKK